LNRTLFNRKTKLRDASIPLLWSNIFKQVEDLNITFEKPLETTNTSNMARRNTIKVVVEYQ